MVIFTPSPSAVASHAAPYDCGAGEIGGESGVPDELDELDELDEPGCSGCSVSDDDDVHAMATALTVPTTTR